MIEPVEILLNPEAHLAKAFNDRGSVVKDVHTHFLDYNPHVSNSPDLNKEVPPRRVRMKIDFQATPYHNHSKDCIAEHLIELGFKDFMISTNFLYSDRTYVHKGYNTLTIYYE